MQRGNKQKPGFPRERITARLCEGSLKLRPGEVADILARDLSRRHGGKRQPDTPSTKEIERGARRRKR